MGSEENAHEATQSILHEHNVEDTKRNDVEGVDMENGDVTDVDALQEDNSEGEYENEDENGVPETWRRYRVWFL